MQELSTILTAHPTLYQPREYYDAETRKEIDKLDQLTIDTNNLLFAAYSVFPFDVFPTQIIIEKTKVGIKHQIFFLTSQIQSIMISDISNVEVDTSIFLSTLKLTNRLPAFPAIVVKNLRHEDAFHAQ